MALYIDIRREKQDFLYASTPYSISSDKNTLERE